MTMIVTTVASDSEDVSFAVQKVADLGLPTEDAVRFVEAIRRFAGQNVSKDVLSILRTEIAAVQKQNSELTEKVAKTESRLLIEMVNLATKQSDKIDKIATDQSAKSDRLERKMDQVATEQSARSDRLERQIDQVAAEQSARSDRLERQIDKVNTEIGELKGEMGELKIEMGKVKAEMRTLRETLKHYFTIVMWVIAISIPAGILTLALN